MTTDDYTPTVNEVAHQYVTHFAEEERAKATAEFDRFLVRHDDLIRAEALEAAREMAVMTVDPVDGGPMSAVAEQDISERAAEYRKVAEQ